MTPDIYFSLIDEVISSNIPDIHFCVGKHPSVRSHQGEIEYVLRIPPVTSKDMNMLLEKMFGPEMLEETQKECDIDTAFLYKESRFRVNIYQDISGISLAMRLIIQDIPSPEKIALPPQLLQCCHKESGLILITGPTGSGKSTTLASFIEYINNTQKRHIVTIEDPIEYTFHSKKSLIHQRQVGTHTKSFAAAMKSILREDPDVIVIGEMRDSETMQTAITLAETGHLVFSTLHTNDAMQSVDRILDSFPTGTQTQIRTQLAQTLKTVISQMLVPHISGKGRVVAREILLNNDAVRNIILGGLTHQLPGIIELSAQDGMILMDLSLRKLYDEGKISLEVLQARIRDLDYVYESGK